MSESINKDCLLLSDLLVVYATGELESELALQVHAHIDECERCAQEFADIQSANEMAGALKLRGEAVDRYPEFLRRLAASNISGTDSSVEKINDPSAIVALHSSSSSKALAEAQTHALALPESDGGLAAVIPFFGRRVAVRTGFGRGFDLMVLGRDGAQLMKLSASSLTRVAAVAAGVAAVPTLALVAGLFLFSPDFGKLRAPSDMASAASQETNEKVRPLSPAAAQPMQGMPLIATVSSTDATLALSRRGEELSAEFIRGDAVEAKVLLVMPDGGNPKSPLPLALWKRNTALATDGKDFLVLENVKEEIFSWQVERDGAKEVKGTLIAEHAMNPTLIWAGDRYIAAFVKPDRHEPVINVLELDSYGKPLSKEREVVRTENFNKVGWPALAIRNNDLLIAYFTENKMLKTRLLANGKNNNEMRDASVKAFDESEPPARAKIIPVSSGYLIFWVASKADGAKLHYLILSENNEIVSTKELLTTNNQILDWQVNLTDNEIKFVWLERNLSKQQIFARNFSVSGEARNDVQAITSQENNPIGIGFFGADGSAIVWANAQQGQPDKFFINRLP
jgi:hypothetical protein